MKPRNMIISYCIENEGRIECSMSKEYVKQHIVPKSYLRNFAKQKKGKYLIGTRYSAANNSSPIFYSDSISDVGYIKNYYDTKDKKENKYWEHFFSDNFETLFGKEFQNIIAAITLGNTNSIVIKEKDKIVLAKIILMQIVRVPSFINKNSSYLDFLIKGLKEELLPVFDGVKSVSDAFRKLEGDDKKNIILDSFFNTNVFNKYLQLLINRTWLVFYNTYTNMLPFVTSDNPVLIETLGNPNKSNILLGIESNKTFLYYPLTPKILIGIYPSDLFFGLIKDFDGKKHAFQDGNFIARINIDLICQSFQNAFLPETLYKVFNPNDNKYFK